MSYINVPPVLLQPAHHVDVAKMIVALRIRPADFEFRRGRLRHIPSGHEFLFDQSARLAIDAVRGCVGRSISDEQREQLFTAFKAWEEFYWRPLEIDRRFVSRVSGPNVWFSLFREARLAWLRLRDRVADLFATYAG